jgi:sigma-B regulation protein RsbU (phosphoserine phosphatase)
MMTPEIWRRTFTGSIPEVIAAAGWVDSIARERALPTDVVFALQICVEELLTNIVRHGGMQSATIDLSLGLFADRIQLIIEDNGKPFDVTTSSHRRIELPLNEVQPGGLGVQLIHSFADRLAYERTATGNRVVAEFALTAAGKVASPVATAKSETEATDHLEFFKPPSDPSEPDFVRDPAFAQVLSTLRPIRLEPEQVLVTQGEPSDAAYYLDRGAVGVYAETPYGPVPLATLQAPRLIGEIGVLADLPRTASVKAVSSATLFRIDRPVLRELGEKTPALLLSVIAQLGRQIDAINKTMGLYTNALSALERREFDQRILEDLRNPPPQLTEFAATFRRFAGQILDKRRQQEEMASAAIIQQSLLPTANALVGLDRRIDIHAAMRPARDVGGDFYDYFMLDAGRFAFAIGDICGKGIPASLFMAVVVTVLRTAAREELTVAGIMARANAIICRDNAASLFATAFFGVLDVRTGVLEYCNCGHNAPILLSAEVEPRHLQATGLPLGLYEDRSAAVASLTLAHGDTLVVYTDGVTEAMDARQQEFGDARLLEEAIRRTGAGSEEMVDGIFAAVDAFAHGVEQADDITCIVISRPSAGEKLSG